MIDKAALDAYFEEDPEFAQTLRDALPSFDPDTCSCVRKTSKGNTPRKTFYIDGKRHTISVRTIAAYFVLNDFAQWVPRISCVDGCVNPHHQLKMQKGVHKEQGKFARLDRAAKSLSNEFLPHEPLTNTPHDTRSTTEKLRDSFRSTMAQVEAR